MARLVAPCKTFDWGLIKDRKNIILAGWLNAKNIAQATDLKCSDYDINYSAESEPGQKDQNKFNEVFDVIRNY